MPEIDVTEASAEESRQWLEAWRQRTEDWYRPLGVPAMASSRLDAWAKAPGTVLSLRRDGVTVGTLAVAERDDRVVISDIWVDPDHRGAGIGRAARTHAEQLAAARGIEVLVNRATDDPAAVALFDGYPLRAQRMVKALPAPPHGDGLTGPGWRARPLREDEYDPWVAEQVAGYAADIADSGLSTPAAAAQRSAAEFRELLPDGLASPGYTWWIIEDEASSTPVASIWLAHGREPGVSFVFSVEVQPGHRGRGFGRAAMLAGEAASWAAGDRHLALNVFGHNYVAIGLYDSLGYVVIEQTRSATPPASERN